LDKLLQPGYQAINNPGVSWAVGDRGKQLFYPEWMEGTWQVSSSSSSVPSVQNPGGCGAWANVLLYVGVLSCPKHGSSSGVLRQYQ
jgi:hypothetical protein